MAYTKRPDGRKFDELRKIRAQVGVIPRADGSALFAFGDTIAIAAVYGPKPLHPQHLQNPEKGVLRVNYDMLSFSVTERKKPGPSRRSQEISKVTEWALAPALQINNFQNTVVDVHITILQANASTRCAGINAASLALAHAGIPMVDLVSAVSIGKIDDKIVTDLIKEEEDYEDGEGATDIPLAFLSKSGGITLMQLDGRTSTKKLKEAIEAGRAACKEIYELQKKVLKEIQEK
ncbi:exosome complex exonuclease Rrp41 [Candidatus Pacearchaeota archaeon RBG_13_36_9]|nr:MAG: exosome complex exonuclease Rrp41 [Candidatus Pacearchaeota archaeon RBG_13_36_9]